MHMHKLAANQFVLIKCLPRIAQDRACDAIVFGLRLDRFSVSSSDGEFVLSDGSG